MIGRSTNFYFAPLTLSQSLAALGGAAAVLLRGVRQEQPARARFEAEWCKKTGALAAVAMPSARSGLYALLEALQIGNGDEVLVTAFTCEAVPEPIRFRGARPVYVEIDRRRFAMDPQAARAAITPRTKAIIVQHTLGLPAPLDELRSLAKEHGLAVIEDCALALGSQRNGRWLGASGDAAIFSFELSKTNTAGWGGMVQVNHDPALAARVRAIRDGGGVLARRTASRRLLQTGLSGLLYAPWLARVSGKVIQLLFALNLFGRSATREHGGGPPPEYLAAPPASQWRLLSGQLARIDRTMQRRQHIAAAYQAVLDRHGCGRVLATDDAGVRLIRFPLLVADRQRFVQAFEKIHVEIGRWFSQPVSCSTGRSMSQYGYVPGTCPVAEFTAAHIVNLPAHERMSDADVALTAACLDGYLARHADEREFIAAALR
jgi:perosamine synthetase